MKIALVYNPLDNKLRPDTYSYIYRGMLEAIFKRWGRQDEITHISTSCSMEDINVDVVLFYDINSKHHIELEGLAKHSALKIECMGDPFQHELYGIHSQYDMKFHKLNAEQRLDRAQRRGIEYIVCATKEGYFQYFSPILGEDQAEKMLIYFPLAPSFPSYDIPLKERKQEVLGNGAITEFDYTFGYVMRKWAFLQPYITFIKPWVYDHSTPKGSQYGKFLKQWAGALALNDYYIVGKYFEMPLAGCVTFAQYYKEYEDLGFKDYEHCIYVDVKNFEERVKGFLADISGHQLIADTGRKLIEENYTADHFADFLYKQIEERI